MTKLVSLSAALAALLALLPAAPAHALSVKTFVSSTGSGTTCSFAAPCGDFQAAHDATFAGGQIACLDSGVVGSAALTKTITIDCAGTSASSSNFTVNGAGIVVTIRNLEIFSPGLGIDFQNGAALFVDNCVIRHMSFSPALAIRFRPSAPGSQLVVTDTITRNNGIAPSTGGGIQVAPLAGGSAGVSLPRVTLGSNVTAMVLNGGSGLIDAVMKDSLVTGNFTNGIAVLGTATLTIKNSQLIHNVGTAISAQGPTALVRLSDTLITGNQTGVSQNGGGSVLSYKNNEIIGNTTDGTPLTPVTGPGGTALQ